MLATDDYTAAVQNAAAKKNDRKWTRGKNSHRSMIYKKNFSRIDTTNDDDDDLRI